MILERLKTRIPLLVWMLVVGTLFCIPLKIIGHGYLPLDDALRHVAKVMSGKSWPEILVMNPELTTDHNPGWHVLLGGVYQLTHWDADGLVVFSVCFLFLVFNIAGVAFLRRPEAWLVAWLVACLVLDDLLARSFYGRPFTFTAGVLISLLWLWGKATEDKINPGKIALSVGLIAAAVWIHGAWYLLALPVAAFFLAGRKRDGLTLAGCWISGAVLGALLTGHPLGFLKSAVVLGQHAFASAPVEWILVTEFKSFDGAFPAVVVVLLTLLWRAVSGRWTPACLRNPSFLLMVMCWVLGFKARRFWSDWGSPAFMVWLTVELNEFWEERVSAESPQRLAWVTALCATLFLAVTADHNRRWSWHLDAVFLSAQDEANADWLPGTGGIIYSDDMRVFYETFYNNPRAPWRYVLGYEPALMTPENLAIYRNIQLKSGAEEPWLPWIKKMRPQDRMMFRATSPKPPGFQDLDWKEVSRIWIGRPKPAGQPQGTNTLTAPNLPAPVPGPHSP